MPDLELDPLSVLAIRHGTDKYCDHDYTPNYHKLFRDRRDRPLRLLEIGVGGYRDEDRGGQSLATWRDYFANAEITGIDIQKKTLSLGDRVAIRQGSQDDPDFLSEVVRERGPFDIIIDDGSHRNEHVVASFGYLWPGLAPGGIYVVEDVQTAFMPRFGGSLTLDAPNSVGHFRDLFAAMGTAGAALPDMRAMERFHNMVALHKTGLGGDAAGIAASSAHGFWADAPVTRLATSAATPGGWRAALAALPARGLILIEGTPDPALLADIVARFVEVDHREIRIAYPDEVPDPVALHLYGIERHSDGLVLMKAPNDYPSNFDFDATHPQASAAIAHMERILADSTDVDGLTAFALMITNIRGREAASPWLDKLDRLEATSREYFQLAAGLAQRRNNLARVVEVTDRALARFPHDPGFVITRVNALIGLDRAGEALAAVEPALEARPRDAQLHLLLARVVGLLGQTDRAIEHATTAITMSPAARKPKAQITLGGLLTSVGRAAEAVAVLQEAAKADSRYAGQAWRALSTALQATGDAVAARTAAEKALALSPETREYQNWARSLGVDVGVTAGGDVPNLVDQDSED